MEVKVKKLNPNAVIPKYAKPDDAGLDLTATSCEYDEEMGCYIYGTGLAIEIPKGFVGLVFPRSSVRKTQLSLTNCVGIIDSGYRGEIIVTYRQQRYGNQNIYDVGERVAQLVILPYPYVELVEAEVLSETERGTGGHGSTGK